MSGILIHRFSAKFVCSLPEGAQVTRYEGRLIVVHPNGPPYTVDLESGKTEPLFAAMDPRVQP